VSANGGQVMQMTCPVRPRAWTERTDWQLSGCAPGKPDRKFYNAVDEVAVLLARDGPHWPELTLGARKLILESRRLVQGSRQDDQ